MPKATPHTCSTDPTEIAPLNYEAALSEIEALVTQMESGQLPLERLLVSYKRGAFLLKFCREQLQNVEDQIKVLEDGELKPWKPAL
jgi:exodeoxyribonuclease VII small subunit